MYYFYVEVYSRQKIWWIHRFCGLQ